jgi:multiple sugar transport system permease protein
MKYKKFALIVPTLVVFVSMMIYPLFYSLKASFCHWNQGISGSFVGFQNYIKLFKSDFFYISLKNTGIFVAVSLLFEFIIGLILALLANRELGKVRPVIRTLIIIPMFISPVAVGIIWRMIYNSQYGIFDWVFGIRGFAPTGNALYAIFFVALVDIWQWTPWVFIIILAALQTIPKEIEEASLVDGANYFQRLFYITLPSISYSIIIVLTLRFMSVTKTLDKIYTLTYGGPGASTETIGFLIFRKAFEEFDIGFATAYSWVYTIIIGIIITIYLRWLNRRFNIV